MESPEVVGWIYNHSRENLWRVGSWYDFEDLVQDGLMVAIHCRARLGPDVAPRQYMAYVKMAFRYHIIALTRSKGNEVRFLDTVQQPAAESDVIDAFVSPELQHQEATTAIAHLPENLRRVVELFLTEEGRRRFYAPFRQRIDGVETEADRLNRLANWPRDLNFFEELQEYLFVG